MLKIKVTRSLFSIVFILLMNSLNNPMKATETNNKYEETTEYTLRQRLTGTTSDHQREQVQHIQPRAAQNSWKNWKNWANLIVATSFTYACILFLDSYNINSPEYGGDESIGSGFGGGNAGGGGAGIFW